MKKLAPKLFLPRKIIHDFKEIAWGLKTKLILSSKWLLMSLGEVFFIVLEFRQTKDLIRRNSEHDQEPLLNNVWRFLTVLWSTIMKQRMY